MPLRKLSRAVSIIFLALLFSTVIHAQVRRAETSPPNFFELQKRYNERLKANASKRKPVSDEKTRDDEETKFRRFEEFWKLRVDSKGSFATYYEQLKAISFIKNCADCEQACYKTNWNSLGPYKLPQPNMGAIISVWVNPNDSNEILAGTFSAGLYRTTNGGLQWERITTKGCDRCDPFPASGGVLSIAVDPKNTAVIYIAVGIYRGMTATYSYGVYKTTNGGANWCPTNLKFEPSEYAGVKKIVMDPLDSNTLFVIAGSKLYKTTDAGATWTVIFTAQNNHELQDIGLSHSGNAAGLYFSEAPDTLWGGCPTSNGRVWFDPNFDGTGATDITSKALGIPTSPNPEVELEKALISVTSNSVSILGMSDAVGCQFATVADRIISRNFNNTPTLASSWTKHINPAGLNGSQSAFYGSAFAVSPIDDNLVLIGSDHGGWFPDDLYISKTGGTDFTLNKPCLHADLRALAFSRKLSSNTEVWIIGNDGGVGEVSGVSSALSNPNTITCKDINNSGLTVTDVLGISNSEVDPTRIYFGAQDNGVFDNTTGTWRIGSGGDGYDVVNDITNPDIAYTNVNGYFLLTTDGGSWGSLSTSTPFDAEAQAWIPPLFIDRSNALYIGKENVWRTYNPSVGASLQKLSNWSDNVALHALVVAPQNSSIIIAAKDHATLGKSGIPKLYRTNSAYYNMVPASWQDITFNLPIQWQVITGIASDEKGENIWVSMGNFGGHVFKLEPGSSVWKDLSDGLPNLPVNVIRYWEGSGDDGLFIGTDIGVYYRNKSMSAWKKISCGLPNFLISDLEINYRLQRLRVAIRGAGVWETNLTALKNQACSGSSYLTVSYTGSNGSQQVDRKDKSVITDAVSLVPITVAPKNICCIEPCEISPQYNWKVYRVLYPSGQLMLVGSGQNAPVSFTPNFGGGFSQPRYNYRIEVNSKCDKSSCPPLTIDFNHW